MSNTVREKGSVEGRKIRSLEGNVSELSGFANVIEDIYDDRLDAIVVRNAFPKEAVATAVELLESDLPWMQPNEGMPGNDIRVLGTAATQTFSSPEGPLLESYLESKTQYQLCNPRPIRFQLRPR